MFKSKYINYQTYLKIDTKIFSSSFQKLDKSPRKEKNFILYLSLFPYSGSGC